MMKRCTKCHKDRGVKFYKNRAKLGGLDAWCTTCRKAYFNAYQKHRYNTEAAYRAAHTECQRRYYQRNKPRLQKKLREAYRQHIRYDQLFKKFRVDQNMYTQILNEQGGVCAICKKTNSTNRALAVDHDHSTNQVRGLLCSNCNMGIGMFGEDPTRLRDAATYLRISRCSIQ